MSDIHQQTDERRHLDSVAGVHRVPTGLRRVDPALLPVMPAPRPIPKPRASQLRRVALDALAWAAPTLLVAVVLAAAMALGYACGHDAGYREAMSSMKMQRSAR